MKNFFSILTLGAIALLSLPHTVKAQDFSDAQKTELQKMFNEYLMNNGEVILESVNKFQAAQIAKQEKEQNEKASSFMEKIKKDTSLPSTGNKDGDITVVEFFDYNCGYCHKALTEIEKLLKADDKVKIVFIDIPILGLSSKEAAKWSLAAAKQDKYFEYHKAIMKHNGPKDSENLKTLAQKVGLDIKKLEKDKENADIQKTISSNLEIARSLGIQGTPGFVIESEVARGFITSGQMQKMITDIRNK